MTGVTTDTVDASAVGAVDDQLIGMLADQARVGGPQICPQVDTPGQEGVGEGDAGGTRQGVTTLRYIRSWPPEVEAVRE
ncbi:hypothetical protein GCM10010495_65520 [Kitasatospora herbaricolor]|nr:hypothetical protein GCM10010495_65520 [Kitasatospora herbaricolor]